MKATSPLKKLGAAAEGLVEFVTEDALLFCLHKCVICVSLGKMRKIFKYFPIEYQSVKIPNSTFQRKFWPVLAGINFCMISSHPK